MKNSLRGLALLLLVMASACSSSHNSLTQRDLARAVPEVPGARSDGSVLLPNQWTLRPVGKQLLLGDFPVNIAVSPNGRFAAVLHCGDTEHEIITVDLRTNGIVSRAAVNEAFYGLVFSTDGKQIFCSGAGDEVVHRFSFADGYLGEHRTIALRDPKQRGIPSGLAVSQDGKKLFVANLLAHRISYIDLTERAGDAPPAQSGEGARGGHEGGTTAGATNGETLFSTNALLAIANGTGQSEDEAAITKRAEAMLEDARSDVPLPYGCALDEKRGRLYVSFWAQSCVGVVDVNTRQLVTRWATEDHPNEMVLSKSGRHLFVANANRNSVSVIDTETGRTVELLVAELLPNSPPGNTPNSLTLTPDEKLLFVANANINTVAVFDVSVPGKSHSLGFIPVGWYPTSVRVTPDGKKLLVANGKGIISKSNRHGPAPGREPPATIREYIAGLMQGTLEVIELPGRDKLESQLKDWTKRAYSCLPAVARTNEVASHASTNAAPGPISHPAQGRRRVAH
jgi:DNA-binding beta-propeller fold protein YncE